MCELHFPVLRSCTLHMHALRWYALRLTTLHLRALHLRALHMPALPSCALCCKTPALYALSCKLNLPTLPTRALVCVALVRAALSPAQRSDALYLRELRLPALHKVHVLHMYACTPLRLCVCCVCQCYARVHCTCMRAAHACATLTSVH